MKSTKIINSPILKNLIISIALGFLALLFGNIRFNLPLIENVGTSLGEIPILISIFYLSNPVYLILVGFIKGFSNMNHFLLNASIHIVGLGFFWYWNKYFLKDSLHKFKVVLICGIGIALYYVILTTPLIYMVLNKEGNEKGLFSIMGSMSQIVSFEAISTILVVTLYLLQHRATRKLKHYTNSLEDKVKERTAQLDETIKQLNEANEELQSNNKTLDLMVSERTKELENRNIQLTGYAFINSHMLRAPLARILGLTNLIKHQLNSSLDDQILIEKFLHSCHELDKIVSLLSKFLTEESVLSKKQLDDLQNKILHIASEIQDLEK